MVPRDLLELRVHGVSGTPPESMLGLSAVPVAGQADACGNYGPAEVRVFRPPHAERDLRAFSWASLTSGRPSHALWLLLLPYVLANVAGWAHVPADARTVRAVAALARLGGLVVTATFALSACLVLGDVLGAQWLIGQRGADSALGPAAGVLVAGVAVGVVHAATHLRVRRDVTAGDLWASEPGDPFGRATLVDDQARLWRSPGVIARLRALHLTTGWGVLALIAVVARPLASSRWTPADVAGTLLAAGVLAAAAAGVTALTLWRPAADPPALRPAVRWAGPGLAGVALLVGAARLAGTDAALLSAGLPAVRGAGLLLAGVTLVLAAAAFAVQAARRTEGALRQAAALPGLLVLAMSTGAAMGAGLALQAARLVGGGVCRTATDPMAPSCPVAVGVAVEWLAIGGAVVLALLLWALLVGFVRAWRQAGEVTGRALVAVRTLTTGVTWLLAMLTGTAAVAIAVGLVLAVGWGLPDPRDLPGWVAGVGAGAVLTPVLLGAAAAVVAGVRRVVRDKPSVAAAERRQAAASATAATLLGVVAAVAVGVLAVIAVMRGWETTLLGVPVPPRSFLDLAQVVTLVLPAAAIARGLWGGLRSRQTRRGVGVLWDVACFWPRWVHPYAPPTYSDRAVPDLAAEVQAAAAAGRRLLLAPHSQGSVIAAAALLLSPAGRTGHVALLTHGSPLGHLYAEAFPAYVGRDALRALTDRLGGPPAPRWRNLYRATDPIGGAVAPLCGADVDVGPLPDGCGRWHVDYAREAVYADAAADLEATLPP